MRVPPVSLSLFVLRHCLGLWMAACVFLAFSSALPLTAQQARWNELNAQALQLFEQGKYTEAIPVEQEALRVAEATFGEEHITVAASAYLLAVLYDKQGQYTEAEPLYKRAITIYEKASVPNQRNLAASLNNLAKMYKEQGRYSEAEPLFNHALEIWGKTLGPDHPTVGASLNNLAALYDDEGRYADAEPLYKRAITIYEKALGSDHPNVARALNNLGKLYTEQGRYAEAEPLYKRALAIREKALGPDHPDVATPLDNLGALYDDQGRYAEAEPLYKRALAIREKALGPDHPDVALSLNNLAELYSEQGRYAEAEPLYKRSLTIYEKILGSDHPQVAAPLNNLAVLYKEQGRYSQAEPFYKRALAIREKALGPDHPEVATSLNNLAALYEAQGRYADAEPLYKRALAIREKALGPDHPEVAISLNNLAELYRLQGRYAEAAPPYIRALTINEKVLGPEHPNVATSLNNLAALYDDQARYADAEPLYKRALAIREGALGPDNPEVATSLNNLGELYFRQRRYVDAESVLRRALAINEKSLGTEHPLEGLSLMNLAALLYAEAQPAQAEPFFDRAFETLANQFQYYFTYMSEKERLAFLATVQYRFPEYFSFCLTYNQQFPGLAGKMYDTVLWEKGFIAQSAAALHAKIQASGDSEALRLLDKLTEKKNELAKLVSAPAAAEAQKQTERRKQIVALEQETNDLEKELVKRSGTLAEEKLLARATWQQVRDALKNDEAAVEIVSFPFYDAKGGPSPTYYVALIVTPESTQPKIVMLGEIKDSASSPMEDYRLLVSRLLERAPAIGTKFYESFWQPLESALGTARRIYVSTDGVLNQVSLGVVPRDDGKLLMEAYDLRIVSSTKDLLRSAHPSASDNALLVGNPEFLLSAEQQRAAVARQRSQSGQQETVLEATGPDPSPSLHPDAFAVRGACDPSPPRGGVLCPLPATAIEVQSIASLLRARNWQVAIDQQENALEEVVKAAQHPRVLHLSTHGFFLSDHKMQQRQTSLEQPASLEDPMLHSGLFFAGADRVLGGDPPLADVDNGVLTAYEATTLNLQGTELVVLSACETGLGQTQAGEGVFGLRRALQEAGAESVLMSMWSVPDKETQELMSLFYENWLSGMEKPEALRHAQMTEREQVEKRYVKDLPYYWGAFVLVGR
jgi:tetratricopeptide (TPR) repeat protein